MLYNLTSLRKTDADRFGAKAANLGSLMVAGIAVPKGFALRVEEGESAGSLVNMISGEFFDGSRVAVRSSAIGEDGAEASFAGQHDTFLNVLARQDYIFDAVKKCFDSVNSEHAVAYRKANGITGTPEMAVIIQKMVDPLCAGVAFSRHPVTGNRDQVYIEAVAGLGEALVSGNVTPASIVMSRRGDVIEYDKTSPILIADSVHLVNLVRQIVGIFEGNDVDVEWALSKDGILYILQARPVTA